MPFVGHELHVNFSQSHHPASCSCGWKRTISGDPVSDWHAHLRKMGVAFAHDDSDVTFANDSGGVYAMCRCGTWESAQSRDSSGETAGDHWRRHLADMRAREAAGEDVGYSGVVDEDAARQNRRIAVILLVLAIGFAAICAICQGGDDTDSGARRTAGPVSSTP